MPDTTFNDTILYVVINGEPILEFDRKKPVPGHQRQYLDNMDAQMDQGVQLGDDFIKEPNALIRSQFVANSLVNMLFKEQYSTAIAMCTYLAKRMPDLQQIQCKGDISESNDKENSEAQGLSIEFVFDRSYQKAQQEQTIQFHRPDDKIH
jgi:hypothetical protein